MWTLIGAKTNTDNNRTILFPCKQKQITDSHHNIRFLINRSLTCIKKQLFQIFFGFF